MMVIAKINNIQAYWTPNGNSHRIAFLTLGVSAIDLRNIDKSVPCQSKLTFPSYLARHSLMAYMKSSGNLISSRPVPMKAEVVT